MGRSFYTPSTANETEDWTVRNSYYHPPSDTHYRMLRRNGAYFQRRFQIGFGGSEANVDEKRIDYVMGSGNRARTYLSRTARGTLVELPLAWYSERGGYWAMNPGYDQARHPQARREIGYDCMFCHNAYPNVPPGRAAEPVYLGRLPEGIDCARCHGAGDAHVAAHGKPGTILNPARLPAARRMEVCYQCHLNPTSFRLPHAVKRYGRGDFSYRPEEPLEKFLLFFDKAGPPDDRFEIAGSAYRLRQSACFLKSAGKLTCTTCHDPHGAHANDSTAYDRACRSCHPTATAVHFEQDNCSACHMPKRRTNDVVHVAMTDHLIRGNTSGQDWLAERSEVTETDENAYRGTVVPYYPAAPDVLHRAAAQVKDRSNLPPGIAQLTAAIADVRPVDAEPYFDLADAFRSAGRYAKAIPYYQEALRREPGYLAASLGLGASEKALGHAGAALQAFKKAPANDARPWNQIGQLQLSLGALPSAVDAFTRALRLNPEFPEAQNGMGVARAAEPGTAAEASFREAIRLQPDYGEAHANLANLLFLREQYLEAASEFELAIRWEPDNALTRFGYGAMLNGLRNFEGARVQLETALRLDNGLTGAHNLLGGIYERSGDLDRAGARYRDAVRLDAANLEAQLNLGAYLLKKGDRAGAREHLEKAAESLDAGIRAMALELSRKNGMGLGRSN